MLLLQGAGRALEVLPSRVSWSMKGRKVVGLGGASPDGIHLRDPRDLRVLLRAGDPRQQGQPRLPGTRCGDILWAGSSFWEEVSSGCSWRLSGGFSHQVEGGVKLGGKELIWSRDGAGLSPRGLQGKCRPRPQSGSESILAFYRLSARGQGAGVSFTDTWATRAVRALALAAPQP